MSSLFSKPSIPNVKSVVAKPELPARPEIESAEDIARYARKRYGRGSTIITGELEPLDIGKRTLLG